MSERKNFIEKIIEKIQVKKNREKEYKNELEKESTNKTNEEKNNNIVIAEDLSEYGQDICSAIDELLMRSEELDKEFEKMFGISEEEKRQREEEKRKHEEEQRKFEEEQRIFEEEQKKLEEEQRILEEEIEERFKKGLTEERKKELEEDIKTMTKNEIEKELIEIYQSIDSMIPNNAKSAIFADSMMYKNCIVILMEGEYIAKIYKELDKKVKAEYDRVVERCKLALEFNEEYNCLEENGFYEMTKTALDDLTGKKDNIEKSNDYFQINLIIETNQELEKLYEEKFFKAFLLYLNKDKQYEMYVTEMEKIRNIINENNQKIK